jgi:hypothetical protein
MPKNSTSRRKCPICNKAFGDKDVVIKYHFWSAKDEEADKARVGHFDCVLHLSKPEKPAHGPKG